MALSSSDAPIVQWFRTSLFQGGSGDSTSPGGRVLLTEVDHGLSISLELILPGSMPERLMGTDCKFVGNMSTLVQIQLGPKICQSTMRWYNPSEIPHTKIKKNPIFCQIPYFPGIVVQLVRAPPCQGGSCGFEPRQSRRIQYPINTSIHLSLSMNQ